MATSAITNTITDPTGTPLVGVTVNARLKPNGGGFRVSDSSEATTLVTTTTNGSGVWTLNLERNANITPGNSYYEVEERIPDTSGGSRTWVIQVGASNQSVYASLVSTPPSSPGVNYITQSSGDARYFSSASKRIMQILVTDPNGSALTTGDGKAYARVNTLLNGMTFTAVAAQVSTVSSSGLPTIQVANITKGWDMLTTPVTIDANEVDSSTAATPAVIDTAVSHDIINTADQLRVDIDGAGTGAKGLIVELTFTPPV